MKFIHTFLLTSEYLKRKVMAYNAEELRGLDGYQLTGTFTPSGGGGTVINGAGFVKASGTTLSYDNSIYVNTTDITTAATRAIILGYKNYTILLTQSSTSAPVPTILDDMITGLVWARTGAGIYTLTKTAAFTALKTIPIADLFTDENNNVIKIVRTSADVMTITTYASTDTATPADGILTNRFLSIKVYN